MNNHKNNLWSYVRPIHTDTHSWSCL